MKISIEMEEISILNMLLREPSALKAYGSEPYSANDSATKKEVIKLINWLEQRVMEPVKDGNKIIKYNWVDKEVELPKWAADRILAIMEHAKIALNKAPFVKPATTLEYKLKGEHDKLSEFDELLSYTEKE